MRPRLTTLPAVAVLFALLIALAVSLAPREAEAAPLGLRFPAPSGTQWRVAAGYNTATHLGVDPHALDLVRVDGPTGGTPVLAPVTGIMGGGGTGDCAWIRASDVTVLICHLIADTSIARNAKVFHGQRLGAVAPDGERGNNGIAHIHLAVNVGGTSGTSLPFDGDYILDGVRFPATTEANAYSGSSIVVTSTNDPSLAALAVTAGDDQTVDPKQRVTLSASSASGTSYVWTQTGGAAVALTRSGATATFTAPDSPGAVLQFQVSATGPNGVGTDSIQVRVRGITPIPVATRGRIISGIVQADGLSLVMFGGGTNTELVSGAGCGTTSATFWVTVAGRFVGYIPAALVPAVNAEWNATFPDGIPASTPMIVRCR